MKYAIWVSLMRGRLAMLLKQFDVAETAYRHALDEDPGCIKAANNLALLYGQQGKIPLAARYFEQALKIEPNNVTALYNLGYIQHKRGERELAKSSFERVTRIDPKVDRAWFGLAMIHAEENRHDLARSALEKAVDAAPDNPHVWYALGMANHALGEKENVKTVIIRLRRFNPRIADMLERDTAAKSKPESTE